jgi:hypothetical protein
LIDAVSSDTGLRDAVIRSQDAALDRMLRQDFAGTLNRFVQDALSTPRRASHDVAFDFWRQFDVHERLADLKKRRPGLYEALPAGPTLRQAQGRAGRGPEASGVDG